MGKMKTVMHPINGEITKNRFSYVYIHIFMILIYNLYNLMISNLYYVCNDSWMNGWQNDDVNFMPLLALLGLCWEAYTLFEDALKQFACGPLMRSAT